MSDEVVRREQAHLTDVLGCVAALLSRPGFRARCGRIGGAEAVAPLQFGHQLIDDVFQQVAWAALRMPAR
jgi:hypothetical protein